MSSSNRWTRTSAAESRAQAQSSNRGQEYRDSQYDDEVRRSEPFAGYALRRSEVIPDNQYRTSTTLPERRSFSIQQWLQTSKQNGFKLTKE